MGRTEEIRGEFDSAMASMVQPPGIKDHAMVEVRIEAMRYLLSRIERLEALQHTAKNVLDVSIATTAAVGGSPHVTSEGKLRIAEALIALRNAVEALEADDGDA
jgi:hypothetical protein